MSKIKAKHNEHHRTETLDYIQQMLREIRNLALGERLNMIAYLVEMAYLETSDVIRGDRPAHVEFKTDDKAAIKAMRERLSKAA